MDINAALKLAREQARILIDNDGRSAIARACAAQDLAEAFQAIDQWLCKGGFLPRSWEVAAEASTELRYEEGAS